MSMTFNDILYHTNLIRERFTFVVYNMVFNTMKFEKIIISKIFGGWAFRFAGFQGALRNKDKDIPAYYYFTLFQPRDPCLLILKKLAFYELPHFITFL